MAKKRHEFESRGVSLVAISSEELPASRQLAQKKKIWFPLLFDDQAQVASQYGVLDESGDTAVPAVFIILPDGKIYDRQIGESSSDRVYVRELLKRVDRILQFSNQTQSVPSNK